MLSFLVRRIVAIVPVLFVVALIVFMMTRFAPGDPAAAIVGNNASAENLERVRSNLGLTTRCRCSSAGGAGNCYRVVSTNPSS